MSQVEVLRDMALFVEVARRQSFSKAAGVIGVPLSSLSRRIAQLESLLGIRLLERTTRRVALTSDGEIYFRHCLQIVEEAQLAYEELVAQSRGPSGTLRTSLGLDLGRPFIVDTLRDFRRLYPAVSFHVDLSSDRPDLIGQRLDLAIRIGQIRDPQLICRRIGTLRFGLYAAPSYLERYGMPGHPSELTDQSCLFATDGDGRALWTLARGDERVEASVTSIVASGDVAILRALAVGGEGVVQLALPNARAAVAEGALVPVLPRWVLPEQPVMALTTSRLTPAKTRLFADFLADRLRGELA